MKGILMSLKHRCVSILCLALVLGACTTSANTAPSAASSAVAVATLTATAVVATPIPSTAASPAGSASPGGGGAQRTPGSIDPCSLLTTEEASKLIGKKLGPGVGTTMGPNRACTFRSGPTVVRLVLAPPAPDLATAQYYWDAERARLPAGLPVKDLKLFDRAAFGAGSAGGLSVSALSVIDGTFFFDLSCALPGCTETASVAAAELIVGRLP
jgi:hypothetical protein